MGPGPTTIQVQRTRVLVLKTLGQGSLPCAEW